MHYYGKNLVKIPFVRTTDVESHVGWSTAAEA